MATESIFQLYRDAYNFLIREPSVAYIEAQKMWLDIAANWSKTEVRDETPLLLVPGAGATPFDLLLTQLWYKVVAGFPNTYVSQTETTGSVVSQIDALLDEAEEFGQPINVVGISAGGTKAIAAACKRPNPFKTVAIVDAPIIPMRPHHFNSVMRRFSINDLLENETMMENLVQNVPDGLRVFSFPSRNYRIFERELTRRPDVPIVELPVDGHLNLNYNTDAHNIIANILCPGENAA